MFIYWCKIIGRSFRTWWAKRVTTRRSSGVKGIVRAQWDANVLAYVWLDKRSYELEVTTRLNETR